MTNETFFKHKERAFDMFADPDTYTVIRLDGKGFSRATAPLRKDGPFSQDFTQAMIHTARGLFNHIDDLEIAYTQSDEISLVLKPVNLEKGQTKWFKGKVQKLVSLSAAYATALFSQSPGLEKMGLPVFDARMFNLDKEELISYLFWRHKDCQKNSVSMFAYSHFPHKSLLGISTKERKKRLDEIGQSWETTVDDCHKYGTLVYKVIEPMTVTYFDKRDKTDKTIEALRSVVKDVSLTPDLMEEIRESDRRKDFYVPVKRTRRATM